MKIKTYFICAQSAYVNMQVWILTSAWEPRCDGAYAFSVTDYENLGAIF